MGILSYPVLVVLFWYKDGLQEILHYFNAFNRYLLKLFSLQALVLTFFRPLKNEYRKNLVVFSILFGMCIKTFLIAASGFVIIFFLVLEVFLGILYVVLPFLPIVLLIK